MNLEGSSQMSLLSTTDKLGHHPHIISADDEEGVVTESAGQYWINVFNRRGTRTPKGSIEDEALS